jgi:Asp-tRNA(Asn)/Glu-tRNA(Gln) amidotransferase A subunit family amidase
VGFKPSVGGINRGGSHDNLSQSCMGVLAATLEDAWQVASEIATRAGGDPGYPGLVGPLGVPPHPNSQRLVFLETAGWDVASPEAKEALQESMTRLSRNGVDVVTRQSDALVGAVEEAIANARGLSIRINTWESRWPLNTYRNRDAGKLSRAMLSRLAQAESMGPDDYRADIEERNRVRALYNSLAAQCDACVTLAAPAAAPVGLGSTGDPVFAVPFSLLGVPAISLPLLREQGLPLGFQVTGFYGKDEAAVTIAGWIEKTLAGHAGRE